MIFIPGEGFLPNPKQRLIIQLCQLIHGNSHLLIHRKFSPTVIFS
jgi:hypothetical protein